MMKIALVAYAIILAACSKLGPFEEIADHKTAPVYACGDWSPSELEKIQLAISDWNQSARLRYGRDLFVYQGNLPDAVYDGESKGDGKHCIYRLVMWNLTPAGRQAWEDYHEEEEHAATYVGDDILVYATLPIRYIEGWILQPVVAHELGHATGQIEHTPADAPYKSILKSKPDTGNVQPVNVDGLCHAVGCLQ